MLPNQTSTSCICTNPVYCHFGLLLVESGLFLQARTTFSMHGGHHTVLLFSRFVAYCFLLNSDIFLYLQIYTNSLFCFCTLVEGVIFCAELWHICWWQIHCHWLRRQESNCLWSYLLSFLVIVLCTHELKIEDWVYLTPCDALYVN